MTFLGLSRLMTVPFGRLFSCCVNLYRTLPPGCHALAAGGDVRFPLGVAVVSGASMQPHLYAGDCVLLRRGLRRGGRARVGDVVLLRRPDRRELLVVKRVTALVADG